MAPEAPGKLVVVELYLQNGELIGKCEEINPPMINDEEKWLHVSWHSVRKPRGYIRVGEGVAYVREEPGLEIIKKSVRPDYLPDSRYAWRDVVKGDGLMLILILPEGYTLTDFHPMPRSAKVFKNKRLAVYWKPEESYGAEVKIQWRVKKFDGDLKSERDRINADIDQSENVPSNTGVIVEDPTGKMEKTTAMDELKRLISRYGERYSTATIYVAFTIVSLLVATILFGILRSTGVMQLVFAGAVRQAEFGGAFAGFLITLIFLVRSYNQISKDTKLTITGNVLGTDGKPVKGAIVFVLGVDRKKETDDTGWFEIEVNEQKSWVINASYAEKVTEATITRGEAGEPVRLTLQ